MEFDDFRSKLETFEPILVKSTMDKKFQKELKENNKHERSISPNDFFIVQPGIHVD